MPLRALHLQSRPQHIQWINDRSPQSPADGPDTGGREPARRGILFVTPALTRVARRDASFEVLERAEVDGGVREHAYEAHGQAAVVGADAVSGPELCGRREDQFTALGPAGDDLALGLEFQGVDRVDGELGDDAADAAGEEFGPGAQLGGVVVAG